jgi:hypothetical protein
MGSGRDRQRHATIPPAESGKRESDEAPAGVVAEPLNNHGRYLSTSLLKAFHYVTCRQDEKAEYYKSEPGSGRQ